MLVVPEPELERRAAANDVTFALLDLADYEGGYVDGKYVSAGFVREVAERGGEPARWAFADAIVAFSREPELDELIRAAAAYPEEGHDEKVRDLLAHVTLMTWFAGEAEKRSDRYLAAYAASKLVLYAGRAVLAHNRLLFPFHKWLTAVLRRAPVQPEGLFEQIDSLVAAPGPDPARALATSVEQLLGVEVPLREAASRFATRTEWSWRCERPPLDDN